MIEKLEEYVNSGQIDTRMSCIHFCIGWLENERKKSVPITVLNYIDELYYNGKLKE